MGITVETVAYSPDSVADYTLMLMLMVVRNAKSVFRRAESTTTAWTTYAGRELRDLTVGVVGTGRIGAAVIERLRGFGCHTLAHDVGPRPRPTMSLSTSCRAERRRHAPHPTERLHAPSPRPPTHRAHEARRVRRQHRRGALLDTEALVAALESSGLGGAALDVLEGEEGIFYADRREGPLQTRACCGCSELPNVLISPHTAYYTDHALVDTVENSILSCLSFEGVMERG